MDSVTKIVTEIRALTVVEFIDLCARLQLSRTEVMNGLADIANIGVYKAVLVGNPEFSRKIVAIKIVRDVTQMTLKDSKDLVDGTTTAKFDFVTAQKINADLVAGNTQYMLVMV